VILILGLLIAIYVIDARYQNNWTRSLSQQQKTSNKTQMNESHVISKKRCPKCAKLGKDTSHDNLVSYSDGHEYCYACGYYIPSSKITGFIRREVLPDDPKEIRLPHDIVSLANAPKEANKRIKVNRFML